MTSDIWCSSTAQLVGRGFCPKDYILDFIRTSTPLQDFWNGTWLRHISIRMQHKSEWCLHSLNRARLLLASACRLCFGAFQNCGGCIDRELFANTFLRRFPKRTNRKQAPGFTPVEVDIQPSQDRPTPRQAPGFIPGITDLCYLEVR